MLFSKRSLLHSARRFLGTFLLVSTWLVPWLVESPSVCCPLFFHHHHRHPRASSHGEKDSIAVPGVLSARFLSIMGHSPSISKQLWVLMGMSRCRSPFENLSNRFQSLHLQLCGRYATNSVDFLIVFRWTIAAWNVRPCTPDCDWIRFNLDWAMDLSVFVQVSPSHLSPSIATRRVSRLPVRCKFRVRRGFSVSKFSLYELSSRWSTPTANSQKKSATSACRWLIHEWRFVPPASFFGWNTSSQSRPSESPKSWLFCPLISLGLRSLETNSDILDWPSRTCSDCQIQF